MKKYLTSFVFAFLVCIFAGVGTACSCSNVRVVEIYFEKASIDLIKGDTIECTAEELGLVVLPSDASDKRVIFTITQDEDTKGNRFKVLDDSNKPILTAVNEGVATITAKSYDGVKLATIKVRVFPKSYTLSAPTGIKLDNSNQKIVWDKEYITLGSSSTKLDEVFYEVKLNGETKQASFENSFSDFEAGVWNKIQIKSVSVPAKQHITSSIFSGEIEFYLLPSPTNLALNNGRLSWDEVSEADSYMLVIHKKNENGELELFKEISNITTTSYDLDLSEAGDFSVVVKACPKSSENNKYTSRASNQVSLIKYDEISTLTVQDDHLNWNAVVGAEEYNIILLNKASNTETKINVKSSAIGQETFAYDLSALNICGDYTARIETISNSTLGLNSKISTISADFTKLPLPKFNGIENNILTWQDMPQGTKVRIFVGETDIGVYDNSFTLPSYFGAGNYSIFAQSIGNGSNLVSSKKATDLDKYDIGKLEAPTTITNVGYDFTVSKVANATNYSFIDVCDENSVIPAEITSKLVSTNSNSATLKLTIPNKKSITNDELTFIDLYRNKYTLKVKALGEKGGRYFDSEYSNNTSENNQAEITFHKMLPFSNVYGKVNALKQICFDRSSDIGSAELNSENAELINSLRKYDESAGIYYYDKFLEVFRLTENGEEEIFQKAISVNSSQLSLIEMLNTKGGRLIFKMSFYGNNTSILHGDGVTAKVKESDNDFVLLRGYEPLNLKVNGTYLTFEVFEKSNDDYFVVFDNAEINISCAEKTFINLNSIITEANKEYNLYIQNQICFNKAIGYWADSMAVPFTIGRLETPTIKFTTNGEIEFDLVENALEYFVVLNDGKIVTRILAEDAENGKIRFDYTELFGEDRLSGISQIKVIASMGKNSEVLLIDSYASNVLTIKDVLIDSISVQNGNVQIAPNIFDLDMQVFVKLEFVGENENIVKFEGSVPYDNELGKFVFEAHKYLNSAGKYNITLWTKYVGAQNEQLYFMASGEYVLNNIIYVPASRGLTFSTNVTNNPIISWAREETAVSYEIWAKNLQTNEVLKHSVSKEESSFNLIYFPNLETGVDYQIAVVSIGNKTLLDDNGDIKTFKFVKKYDNNGITIEKKLTSMEANFEISINFDSLPNYLERYKESSAFSKVAEVKDFDSTISNNELSLTWSLESGVEYNIFKNEEQVATVNTNSYQTTIDTENEKTTRWSIRAIYLEETNAQGNKVYFSALSNIITIEVLNSVTNLQASGYLTFEHDKDDCEYKIEIVDKTDLNTLVGSIVSKSKEIDLSSIAGLISNHSFTIKVTALSNGKTYITSSTAEIENIQKTATPVLSLNATEKTFSTNNASPYVKYLLAKFDDEEQNYTTHIASQVFESSASSFDCLTLPGITSGKYKIWAVGMSNASPENEIFSTASNVYYFTLLKEITALRLVDGKITFKPAENVHNYVIKIDDITCDVEIQDTTVDYSFTHDKLNQVGEHIVSVSSKGNYSNPENIDFSCTFNSISSERKITKLEQPNIQLNNENLNWSIIDKAQGYKLIFKSESAEKVEIILPSNCLSFNLQNVTLGEGKYSVRVVALGNDSSDLISSEESGEIADIQMASIEQINLVLSQENRRLEWNLIAGDNTYVVTFGNSANASLYTFETKDNYFYFNNSKTSKLTAGQYNVSVKVKGNNSGILDGKPSNELRVNVLEAVSGIYKTHTNEQIYNSKATINFSQISGLNSYLIIVIKPDLSCSIIDYEYNINNLPEITFESVGDYFVGVCAKGDYLTTVDGVISGMNLTKIPASTGLQFSYGPKEDYATTALFWSKLVMSNPQISNLPISLVFDAFFDSDYFETGIFENDFGSVQLYERDFSCVLRPNLTEFRVLIKVAQDCNYISSDWAVVNVNTYGTPNLEKIDKNLLHFKLSDEDNEEEKAQIKGISVEFFSLANELIYAEILNYNGNETLDLYSVIEKLPVGEMKARIRIIGNGETFVISQVSNEIQFTKINTVTYTVQAINNGERIGNLEIVWNEVPNATGYEIYENDILVITIPTTSYEIDRRLEELNVSSLKFSIRAVGSAGYLSASKSLYLIANSEKAQLEANVNNGSIFVEHVEQGPATGGENEGENNTVNTQQTQTQNRIIAVIDGKNVIVENGVIDYLSDQFEGGINHTFQFKELLNTDIYFENILDENDENLVLGYRIKANSQLTIVKQIKRLNDVAPITVIDGYIYGKLVELTESFSQDFGYPFDENIMDSINLSGTLIYKRTGAYVEVFWEDINVKSIIPYKNDKLDEYVHLGLPPTALIGLSSVKVKYRVIGDVLISSRFSSFEIDLNACILDSPEVEIENGLLKWNNVSNTSKYGIYFNGISNYDEEKGSLVSGKIQFQGTDNDLIKDSHTICKYIEAGITFIDLELVFEEIYSSYMPYDLSVTILVVALGSPDASMGITYLSSCATNRQYIVYYAPPSKFKTSAGMLYYETTSSNQILRVDGIDYDWNIWKTNDLTTYENIFSNVKEYSVAIKAFGDGLNSISSVWSTPITVYKSDPVSEAWIDENGFFNFKITQTGSKGLDYVTKQGAMREILVYANNGIKAESINKYSLEINSEEGKDIALANLGAFGEYPNYAFGHLDFLEAGINSLKLVVVGNTQMVFDSILGTTKTGNILSSSFHICNNVFNKLATPTNVRIENSTLKWNGVENASGYLVQIVGKQDENTIRNVIEVSETSLDLLNKSLFPQGTYTITIRAKGNANNLTSSSSEEVECKVFKTPEVSILNGQIKILTSDENTSKTIIGVHKGTGQTFIIQAENDENAELFVEVPDYIFNAQGEKIYLQEGEYLIKVQSSGDGITTINSDYTAEITGNKLNRIDYVSSYNGSLEWRAIKDYYNNTVVDYAIYLLNQSTDKKAVIKVDENNQTSEGYFRLDLPMDFVDFSGNVSVYVKALGNNLIDLNGAYSEPLQAHKVRNVSNFGVDSEGKLSWSFNDVAEGFRVVVFDLGSVTYVENKDTITQLKCELPTTIVSPNGETVQLNAGKHNIAIKVVGKNDDSIHYLSSICKPQEFEKILPTNSFVVENGQLRWEKVANSTKYELIFTHKNTTTGQETVKATQYVVENSANKPGGTSYRYFTMATNELPSGLYSSIKIRAIGGTINDKPFVNSSSVELKNIWKLDAPSDVQMVLSSESSSNLIFKFYPIKFTIESQTTIIETYRIKITNLSNATTNSYDFTIGDENTLPSTPSASTLIEHTFKAEDLNNGRYKVEIMAVAPSNTIDLTQNHSINSQYCTSINVSKPTPPQNFTFDSNLKCFKWDAPKGFEEENITYELYYITRQNEESSWSSIQKVSVQNKTLYYPPTLGEYKMVILASVENCLKSDYMGKTVPFLQVYKTYSESNLLEFINNSNHGVYGSNASLFAGGEGTQGNPYIISSAEQFANMKYYATSGFYFQLSQDIGSTSYDIDYESLVQGENLDGLTLAGAGNEFMCHLNGNGYTIYLNSIPTLSNLSQGLFAFTNNATIRNLKLIISQNVEIASNVSNLSFGALIGQATNTSIENVSVYANMILPHLSSGSVKMIYVGGLVGQSNGSTTFNNCRFEGSIKFNEDASAYSTNNRIHTYIGGITAQLISTGSTNIPFNKCINLAELAGTIVGGIVARSDYGLENCVNLGNISAIRSESSVPQSGGLVGVLTLSNREVVFLNSYSRGNITTYLLSSAQNSNSGGILGKIDQGENYAENSARLVIANNFNAGIVKNNSTAYKSTLGWLIGHTNSTNVKVINSYNFCLDQTGASMIVGGNGNNEIENTFPKSSQLVDESTITNSGTNSLGSFFNSSQYVHSFQLLNGKVTIINLSENSLF